MIQRGLLASGRKLSNALIACFRLLVGYSRGWIVGFYTSQVNRWLCDCGQVASIAMVVTTT